MPPDHAAATTSAWCAMEQAAPGRPLQQVWRQQLPQPGPGQVLVLFAVALVALLVFVGLAVDAGAIYITAVCLMPEFLIVGWNVPFYFGGTSLLIVVVVVMDFMAQVQSHLMSHQYESVMKKANLKNYGGAGRVR